MGSELPGGYSTVIIRPSLPGKPVRSFDMSCVTSASCATSAPDMRHTAKTCFVNVIDYLSFDPRHFNASGVLAASRGDTRVPVPHAASLRCRVRPAATGLVQAEDEWYPRWAISASFVTTLFLLCDAC